MDRIIDDGEYIKHIWESNIEGYTGCENCSISDKSLCPKDCKPSEGCYRCMEFREIKYMEILKRWKEKHNKQKMSE